MLTPVVPICADAGAVHALVAAATATAAKNRTRGNWRFIVSPHLGGKDGRFAIPPQLPSSISAFDAEIDDLEKRALERRAWERGESVACDRTKMSCTINGVV